MMKKFLTILLAGVMMAGILTGCGGSDSETTSQPTPEPTPKVWYQNPLTGEEQSIDSGRMTAVKAITNDLGSVESVGVSS